MYFNARLYVMLWFLAHSSFDRKTLLYRYLFVKSSSRAAKGGKKIPIKLDTVFKSISITIFAVMKNAENPGTFAAELNNL